MVNTPKKYNDLLNTARELFWKHGFKRVSVEEICIKAGVSKMTYYKYFPNKTELAKTIFHNVTKEAENTLREILRSDLKPMEKVKKMMLLKLERSNNISPEFLQDFYMSGEPELKAYVETRSKEAWEALKEDFKEAQQQGVFRKDLNTEFLIRVQYKLSELVNDKTITDLFESRQEMIMAFANLIVYGIVQHEE